jgi:mutator protein MutT
MSLQNPVEVVCAILERDGLVLVAERPAGKRLAGYWEFPGGKIEPGESSEAALQRELEEELGCVVDVLTGGPPVLHDYEWGQVLLHPFRCRLREGSRHPMAREHAALKWVESHELANLRLAPADIPILAWLLQS